MYDNNHTDRPHNMRSFARDVEHEWRETSTVNDFTTTILVCQERPEWAKKRNYFLAALFGCSPMIRTQLMNNSNKTTCRIVKQVNEFGFYASK